MGRRTRCPEKNPVMFTDCRQLPYTPCISRETIPAGPAPPNSEKKRKPPSGDTLRTKAYAPSKGNAPRQSCGNFPAGTTLTAAQRADRETSRQPSEPGRGGDPRYAGAPQQARISPAKREDARRLAPAASGELGTRDTTEPPSTTRTRGSTGVVGGVEGHAPLTPCPSPGGDHTQMPGSSRKPAAKKENPVRRHPPHQGIRSIQGECSPPIMRELSCRDDAHRRSTRRPGDIPPAQRAGARRRSPLRGSAAAGAHIAREAGRCAPTCPCGERRTGYT